VLLPQKAIATLVVDFGARKGRAPQEPLLHRTGPPVEMGIDNPHTGLLQGDCGAAHL
jgi:hypothetical protein